MQISQTTPTANPFPLPSSGIPGQRPITSGENPDLGSLTNGNPQMANLFGNTDGLQGLPESLQENGAAPGGMPNFEAWNEPSANGVDARGGGGLPGAQTDATSLQQSPQTQQLQQSQQFQQTQQRPQQVQGLMNGNRGGLNNKPQALPKNGLNGNGASGLNSGAQDASRFSDTSSTASQPNIPGTSSASANVTPTSFSDNDVSLNVRKDESGRQRLQDSSAKQGQNYELANKNALSNIQTGQQMGEQANQHGQAQNGLQDLASKNAADGMQNMDLANMNNQAGQQAGQMAGIQQLMAQAMQMVQQMEKMKFAQGQAVEQSGKATEAQGKGIETMGQATEANGHATEKTGHATEATGVGMQTTATGMLASGAAAAASLFGAPAGAALLAAGTALMGLGTGTVMQGVGLQGTGLGLQGLGKGQQATGQATQQAGQQTQQTGQQQQNQAKTAEQKAKEEEEKKKAESERLLEEMKKLLEQAQQNQNQAGQNFGDANKNSGLANQQGNLANQAADKAKLANEAAKIDRDLAKKAKNNRDVVDNALDQVFGEAAKGKNGARGASSGNEAGQIQPVAQNYGESNSPFGDNPVGGALGGNGNRNGAADQARGANALTNRNAANRPMSNLTNRNTQDPRKNGNAQGLQGATANRRENAFGAQAGDARTANPSNAINPMAASQGSGAGNQGQGGNNPGGGQSHSQQTAPIASGISSLSSGQGSAPARGSGDSPAANPVGGGVQNAAGVSGSPNAQAQSFNGLNANPSQGFGNPFNPSANGGTGTAFNRGVDLNGQGKNGNSNAAMSRMAQQPKGAFAGNKGARSGEGEGQSDFTDSGANNLNGGLQNSSNQARPQEATTDDNSTQTNARFEQSDDSVTVNLNDLSASSGTGSQSSSDGGSKGNDFNTGGAIAGMDGLGGGAGTDSDGPIGGSAQLFGSKKETPNFSGLNGISGLSGLSGSGNALPASSSSNTPSSLNLT